MPDVTREIAEGVRLLTLSRPERRNAFSGAMGRELGDAYAHWTVPRALEAVRAFLEKRDPVWTASPSHDFPDPWPL